MPGRKDAGVKLRNTGFRLGVATNDSTSGAENTLLMLGVSQMLDVAYVYDRGANQKPAPDSVHTFFSTSPG